jgi:site-specific DNA-methyltransferase (adenine-specific)
METEEGNFRITYPSNFWDDISIPFWSMPENTDHPTQKPEKLIAKLILASSEPGDIVFDPFLGSGSTLIACCETDRVCRGVELDPKFVDCIVKRYIEWAGGRYDDVYVIRDDQKLRFDEAATFEAQEVGDE